MSLIKTVSKLCQKPEISMSVILIRNGSRCDRLLPNLSLFIRVAIESQLKTKISVFFLFGSRKGMRYRNLSYVFCASDFLQINFILRILQIISDFEMKDQIYEEGSLHQAILHQTKEKYKQLNSSLLLTSSLISHKHKISQQRKQGQTFPPLPSCKGLLKTSKMYLQEGKCLQQQPQKVLSNIQELKFLARKLQQEQMTKLGKQNRKVQDGQNQIVIPLSQTQISINKNLCKKLNKRKIVKGRPQMNVFIKKRRILNALYEEEKEPEFQCTKTNFRQTINDILNKNANLKFITKNKIGSNKLYNNMIKEKQEDFIESTQNHFQGKMMRKSAVSFKNMEKTSYLNRFKTREQEDSKQPFPLRHFSLGHKRYSASQSIQ